LHSEVSSDEFGGQLCQSYVGLSVSDDFHIHCVFPILNSDSWN